MATVTASKSWVSGETVTPAGLNLTAAPTVVVADNEITTAKILDANVTAAKLASNAVETAKIADDAVTNDKLSLAANDGEIKKAINADNSPPIYACRAWVNFNGNRNAANTGASTNGANVLIRESGNVASVLKNVAGNYTITFTTPMPDANYCVTGIASSNIGAEPNSVMVAMATTTTYGIKTAAAVQIFTADTNAIQVQDCFDVNVAIFR
jgi:hypothetical protein